MQSPVYRRSRRVRRIRRMRISVPGLRAVPVCRAHPFCRLFDIPVRHDEQALRGAVEVYIITNSEIRIKKSRTVLPVGEGSPLPLLRRQICFPVIRGEPYAAGASIMYLFSSSYVNSLSVCITPFISTVFVKVTVLLSKVAL